MIMEALFAQFSYLANQALDDKDFDPSKLDELLLLFEQEACAPDEAEHALREAEASLREADDYLNSLMDAAMDDFHHTYNQADKSSQKELCSLFGAADAEEKKGRSAGAAAARAAKKYMDAALGSAMATMKSAVSTAKIHPS